MRLFVLLILLALLAPASLAAAPSCTAAPGARPAAGCDLDGDGVQDATVGGSADPAARNITIRGQVSEAPIPGGMEDRVALGDGASPDVSSSAYAGNATFQCSLDGCAVTVRGWDPTSKGALGGAERSVNVTFTVDGKGPELSGGAEAQRNDTGLRIKPIRCELKRGCSEEHGASAGPVQVFGHSQGAIHGEGVVLVIGGSTKSCSLQTREPATLEAPDLKCAL